MSRASDITLFLILLQAAIGFIDATGMFDQSYLGSAVQNNATYTLTDLSEYKAVEDQTIFDEVLLLAHWGIESFFIAVKIIFAVIFVFPMLITKFQVPIILSAFIQVGVYYVYATWYAQYKSGKGWKLYE